MRVREIVRVRVGVRVCVGVITRVRFSARDLG